MATPVIREAVRDYMADQFRKHGTTEFTAGEITRGLEAEGMSFGSKQVTNALQSLKALNKAIQTRKVPGAVGGAMRWALVSVLEAATAPAIPTTNTTNTEEENPAVTGNAAAVPTTRKPRHDDPEHIEHAVTKQLKEFEERLTKQFAVMQTDFESVVKSKITSAMEGVASAPSASIGLTEHDTANIKTIVEAAMSTVYTDAVERSLGQDVMSFADIGAKLSEENTGHMHKILGIARDFVTTYDATTAMMKELLIKSVTDDELKEQGFIRGFSVGYEACEARYREAIQGEVLKRMGKVAGDFAQKRSDSEEHSPDCPNGNAPGNPLKETLRKLGAK